MGSRSRGLEERRKDLEQAGYQVYDVAFQPARGNTPAQWQTVTVAKYARLTWSNAGEQALNVWVGINGVIGQEPAVQTAGQHWTK